VCFIAGKQGPDAARVLLVSSSGGRGWVFPKGGWELDETVKEAARRETVEEAGVRGDLEEPQLGVYPYCSRKVDPQRKGCIAHLFVMHVKEELQIWPEAGHRTRQWVRVYTSYIVWQCCSWNMIAAHSSLTSCTGRLQYIFWQFGSITDMNHLGQNTQN
jgi:diphosphoinositol-polyphosphate diphosphatase